MWSGLMSMGAALDTKTVIILFLLLSVGAMLIFIAFLPQPACAGCNAKVDFIFSPDAEGDVIDFIRTANSTIDIEIYTFSSEEVIRELGEAESRGVEVRVIMEPRVDDSRKTRVYALLSELGVDMKWASLSYKLTHSKFIIVDGKKALIGSINLSESALNKNREAAVLVEGEGVKELVAIFEEDWEKGTEG